MLLAVCGSRLQPSVGTCLSGLFPALIQEASNKHSADTHGVEEAAAAGMRQPGRCPALPLLRAATRDTDWNTSEATADAQVGQGRRPVPPLPLSTQREDGWHGEEAVVFAARALSPAHLEPLIAFGSPPSCPPSARSGPLLKEDRLLNSLGFWRTQVMSQIVKVVAVNVAVVAAAGWTLVGDVARAGASRGVEQVAIAR